MLLLQQARPCEQAAPNSALALLAAVFTSGAACRSRVGPRPACKLFLECLSAAQSPAAKLTEDRRFTSSQPCNGSAPAIQLHFSFLWWTTEAKRSQAGVRPVPGGLAAAQSQAAQLTEEGQASHFKPAWQWHSCLPYSRICHSCGVSQEPRGPRPVCDLFLERLAAAQSQAAQLTEDGQSSCSEQGRAGQSSGQQGRPPPQASPASPTFA